MKPSDETTPAVEYNAEVDAPERIERRVDTERTLNWPHSPDRRKANNTAARVASFNSLAEQGAHEYIFELEARVAELEHLISDAPHNLTLLPPEFQRLWESLVRLSDKAEFKVIVRYIERVETQLTDTRAPKTEGNESGVVAAMRPAELPFPDCFPGIPMMHGDKPYRWCGTHNRLMLACEVASVTPSPAVSADVRVKAERVAKRWYGDLELADGDYDKDDLRETQASRLAQFIAEALSRSDSEGYKRGMLKAAAVMCEHCAASWAPEIYNDGRIERWAHVFRANGNIERVVGCDAWEIQTEIRREAETADPKESE